MDAGAALHDDPVAKGGVNEVLLEEEALGDPAHIHPQA